MMDLTIYNEVLQGIANDGWATHYIISGCEIVEGKIQASAEIVYYLNGKPQTLEQYNQAIQQMTLKIIESNQI